MRPGTYVLIITSPINAGLNYLFVYTLKIGLLGAPLATGISYWLSCLLLLAYTRFIAGYECWGGFDRRCLQNIGSFAKIAILGVVHVGTEWWAFEIVAIVAGQLGTIPLAAQSVIMTADQVSLRLLPLRRWYCRLRAALRPRCACGSSSRGAWPLGADDAQ